MKPSELDPEFVRTVLNTTPEILAEIEKLVAAREAGAPKVGDLAPEFCLPLVEGTDTMRLSDYRGRQPVALIFGSYT